MLSSGVLSPTTVFNGMATPLAFDKIQPALHPPLNTIFPNIPHFQQTKLDRIVSYFPALTLTRALESMENTSTKTPYSHSRAFDEGYLQVSSIHKLHYEQYGKIDGKPGKFFVLLQIASSSSPKCKCYPVSFQTMLIDTVIFLHGGPGGNTSQANTIYFNPDIYRVILFDQRGAGRSTPSAEIQDNTTQHLIEDIESLRIHFEVAKWHLVFGGSWGSALALLYTEAHPKMVGSLILRGIHTCRKAEFEWTRGPNGAARIYPDAYERFLSILPENDRQNPYKGYYDIFLSQDHGKRLAAARNWSRWDLTISTLVHNPQSFEKLDDESWVLSHALLEAHYFVHNAWIEEGQILREENLKKIRHIPSELTSFNRCKSLSNVHSTTVSLVQGRYDIICSPQTAWDLHKALPESRLFWIAAAGHNVKVRPHPSPSIYLYQSPNLQTGPWSRADIDRGL